MSLLDVDDLTIRYGDSVVVDRVSFSIDSGAAVGLVGESGSGKSQTAMAMLALLEESASVTGSVSFNGAELLGAGEEQLDKVRGRHIGFVFQDPLQALNPYVRVGQQLRQVLLRHRPTNRRDADTTVLEMLARVGLPDPRRQSRAYSHELSGGMRQRVVIAAALIAEPELLIADEPTTALDVTVQAQILELLHELRENTALLLITHDLGVVAAHCERMLVLEEGCLVESGETRVVFAAPEHRHTQALLRAAPNIHNAATPASSSGKAILNVEAAAVSYREQRQQRLNAVIDVSLTLHEAETLAIVGESGSGKSSLVRAILGLTKMPRGRVVYLGEELRGPVQSRTLLQRRELQLIFQNPQAALNPAMQVRSIVAEPLLVHNAALPPVKREARVLEVLQRVGLGERFMARYPHQLSGGQAQRVAIARALILSPRVLICDEAVTALDGTAREQVLGLLRTAQQDTGLSIIFIAHDLAVVRAISHRVMVMYMGRLVEIADGQTLFAQPRHPYSKALLDAVPIPDPLAGAPAEPLKGEVPSILSPPTGCAFHPRCAYASSICSKQLPALRELDGTRVACHRADEIDLRTL